MTRVALLQLVAIVGDYSVKLYTKLRNIKCALVSAFVYSSVEFFEFEFLQV